MAQNITTENLNSVVDFINTVADDTKRNDCFRLIEIFQNQTGLEPKMWGSSIVGFGSCHYKYESGHEGDMPIVSFAPRAAAISLYLYADPDKKTALLQKMGKIKTGKGCIYVKKLADINIDILKELISVSVAYVQSRKP